MAYSIILHTYEHPQLNHIGVSMGLSDIYIKDNTVGILSIRLRFYYPKHQVEKYMANLAKIFELEKCFL